MYSSEFPFTSWLRCGTSSMKTISQHSLDGIVSACTVSRTIRELCGSRRTDAGDTRSAAPHDFAVDPGGKKRLTPSSVRSQSEREIVAWTGLSDLLASEIPDDTGLDPVGLIVSSSGSTRSCARASTEIAVPRAKRASTAYRTRPLLSAPANDGEREARRIA